MNDDKFEQYEDYAEEYKDMPLRKNKKSRNKKINKNLVAEMDKAEALESGFQPTYQPTRYEKGWLLESLTSLYHEELIVDVNALVKGGKEATVYRCAGHESLDREWVAAKVYRPRQFRGLRNDKLYRQGRALLSDTASTVTEKDQRLLRAVDNRSFFGSELQHRSWLLYEYMTLKKLHEAGAAVPEPFGVNQNTILMEYVGDEYMAAPTLNQVKLELDEAQGLFTEVCRNIELMLNLGIVHGDLSAYNILYWDGTVTMIDFPQVVECIVNRSAPEIFTRDVVRVCEYFAGQGVAEAADPRLLADQLWERYVENQIDNHKADFSQELLEAIERQEEMDAREERRLKREMREKQERQNR